MLPVIARRNDEAISFRGTSLRGTKQSHDKTKKNTYEPNHIATMKLYLRRTLVLDNNIEQNETDHFVDVNRMIYT